MSPAVTDWVALLRAEAAATGPTSTADRAAATLRALVTAGHVRPGTRVSEHVVADALGVSRNTLREAFRLLSGEQLLEHRVNRGVFVRELSATDVADIYLTRTLLECAAIRESRIPSAERLEPMRAAVVDAQQASTGGDATALGSADIAFHQAVVGLVGGDRLNAFNDSLFAQLRLAFHVVTDPFAFHATYVERNARILAQIETGRAADASDAMRAYLTDARDQILAALAATSRDPQDISAGRVTRRQSDAAAR